MKKRFLFLATLFSLQLLFAQTKTFPDCKAIANELITINNSFDNIVEKFKSKEDKISFVKTYFSEFSICNEKGKIKDYGRNVEFSFRYSDADYKGGKNEFNNFFEKLVTAVNEVFAPTHHYKLLNEEAGRSGFFYEKDKDLSTSKRLIRLLLSSKDAADETEAFTISLVFEYYPKR